MDARIQDGYYIWEPPGQPIAVHVHLEVVDRLLAEVMRGFGAMRKRGVEIGGLLIGSITEGTPSIVRIDDFEPVPCEYRRGPSYLFGEDDGAAFENAYQRWRPSVSSTQYAVGYFRSHTRDGMSLAAEDVELMDDCFPEPSHVALLIKPAATTASMAGFFFRENGAFQPATPLEFPFRRRDLTGEDPPLHRSLMDRRRSSFEGLSMPSVGPGATGLATSERALEKSASGEITYTIAGAPKQQLRAGWVWMPLSFVFLLLGLMIGFQVALVIAGRTLNQANDYTLALSVSKTGDNLLVKWNPDAPLVRAADRGELEIEDRGLTKPVPLDRANLQNGTITVQRASSSVRFRLTVYPPGRVSATEVIDWRQ